MNRITVLIASVLLFVSFLTNGATKSKDYFGDFGAVAPSESTSLKADADWYKNAVFYHIWVKGFSDSDGDNIGDIKGIIQKLDYLNDGNPATTTDLGITGIWLSPIFECDYKGDNMHGYDTTDYYKINSKFGTEEDVVKLLEEAHKRGIRVIFDYVVNHTSDKNQWFKDSVANKMKKRNWYIWEKQPSEDWRVAWGGGNWRSVWHPWNGYYYYGAFYKGMPDLNLENKIVREHMGNILTYWLNKGFDGIRIDAVRYAIENGPGRGADTPATHKFFQKMRSEILDKYNATGYSKMMVGEAWTEAPGIKPYYGNGNNEFHMCFDFPFAYSVSSSVNGENPAAIKSAVKNVVNTYPAGYQNATFLNNHDEVVSRPATLYRGDNNKVKIATALSLLTPGTPFIYYGNEIAMKDGAVGGDRKFRTNFEWNTVPAQINDPNSIFNFHRNLIDIKVKYSALRTGKYIPLDTNDSDIYAFIREDAANKIIVIMNFSKKEKNFVVESEDFTADTKTLSIMSKVIDIKSDSGIITFSKVEPQSISILEVK